MGCGQGLRLQPTCYVLGAECYVLDVRRAVGDASRSADVPRSAQGPHTRSPLTLEWTGQPWTLSSIPQPVSRRKGVRADDLCATHGSPPGTVAARARRARLGRASLREKSRARAGPRQRPSLAEPGVNAPLRALGTRSRPSRTEPGIIGARPPRRRAGPSPGCHAARTRPLVSLGGWRWSVHLYAAIHAILGPCRRRTTAMRPSRAGSCTTDRGRSRRAAQDGPTRASRGARHIQAGDGRRVQPRALGLS
jgi:hypothetical protein